LGRTKKVLATFNHEGEKFLTKGIVRGDALDHTEGKNRFPTLERRLEGTKKSSDYVKSVQETKEEGDSYPSP